MKQINKELLEDLQFSNRMPASDAMRADSLKDTLDAGVSAEDSMFENMTNSQHGDQLGRNMPHTSQSKFRDGNWAGASVTAKKKQQQDTGKIHSLYQDLYLTDLKNDVGELETDLTKEKEKNLKLQQMLEKCKKELNNQKRTIANYRKAVTDMQKDFFGLGSARGVPTTSSITMTSAGMGVQRLGTNFEEHEKADDALSTNSAARREREIRESTSKVQQYLETNRPKISAARSNSQLQAARTVKVNYNTMCDTDRAERFKGYTLSISSAKKLPKVLALAIKDIKNVLNCHSCAIFLTRHDLFLNKDLAKHRLQMQRTLLEGRAFDVVNSADEDMHEPRFKKYVDAASTHRSQSYMAHPIFSADGELIACIQVLSKEKKNARSTQRFFIGFSNFDEIFLAISTIFIQTKFQQIMAQRRMKKTQKEVVETIHAASIICTQRSYSDFIVNCREVLPQYFGFDAIGILFRDQTDDQLFAFEEEEDEDEADMRKQKQIKTNKGQQLTAQEQTEDFVRQYRRRTWNKFSNMMGITGQVFHSGVIIRENTMARLSNYQPSIDNRTDCQDVRSIMVVPIYGHRAKMVPNGHGVQESMFRETADNSKRKPIAIFQFINKKDFKQIDEYDEEKIRAMQDLLGHSIENASEHHAVINAKIGVQQNLLQLNARVGKANDNNEDFFNGLNEVSRSQILISEKA